MKKVKQDKDHAHEELGSLENEAEILKRQDEAIKAEEAHRKKQEAEASRRGSSGQSEASSSKPSAPSSSGFIRPASGTFTSGFGKRSLGNHFGVDIAKRGSGVPINAAAAGTVIMPITRPATAMLCLLPITSTSKHIRRSTLTCLQLKCRQASVLNRDK